MKLPPQPGLGALQPVALGFRQRLAGPVDIELQLGRCLSSCRACLPRPRLSRILSGLLRVAALRECAVFRCSAMINSMPLLVKTSAAAIGSCAGMRELEPAGGVNRCGRYVARRLWPTARARERLFPGVFSSDLVHGLAAGSALERGAKSLWPQVAVASCRCDV
jgi:hypothetical protein